jgi:large subunit ribosomal protein L25
MSTARPSLAAAHREVTGKAVARLRRQGVLPAVLYGHGVDSVNVQLDAHDFDLLRRRTGPNTLVDLALDGKKANPVLVHGVQLHPVSRRPLHVDLFLVRMTEELTVDVPLVAVGSAPAVELHAGTLLHPTETVRVRALPDNLPQSIEYPVDSLVDFDASIHVRDLEIPAGATLLTDGDEVVAKVLPPRVEVEEAPAAEAEAEGAEAAEGEAGQEAAAATESDSESESTEG